LEVVGTGPTDYKPYPNGQSRMDLNGPG